MARLIAFSRPDGITKRLNRCSEPSLFGSVNAPGHLGLNAFGVIRRVQQSMDVSKRSTDPAIVPAGIGPSGDTGVPLEDQSGLSKRITLRLIPLLFCCYVIAYID